YLGERGDERHWIDRVAAAVGLGLLGFQASDEGVVLFGPMLAALLHGLGVDLSRAHGFRQRLQRGGDVAFQIGVGVQLLIDHVAFELVLVDRDDLALGRLGVRRIPGRAAADQKNEIGVLEMLVGGDPEIERVVGREIGKIG